MDKKRATSDDRQAAIRTGAWPTPATGETTRDRHDMPARRSAGASLRQRVSIRKPMPCSILVKAGSAFVIARKIHDISMVGAFVEMDTTDLAVGDIVEVVIGASYNQRQIEHQISAEIVRIEAGGVGIRFRAYDNRTYTDLVNFLYAM